MKSEYLGNEGCQQRDSAEREEYAGARSIDNQEAEEADGADLLERILDSDNLNRAYKRVKANKGGPGIDGMTVEDVLSWLREHGEELLESIRSGKYKPQPVRRKEIPKPDGGIRKLGIATVVDRVIQQAIASLTGTSPCTFAVEPPCTERYAQWCERSVTQLMGDLLLDCECIYASWSSSNT